MKPPKIVITPVKDAKDDTDGENNPEDVGAPVEHETSDDKTDGEDGDAAKAKTGSLDKLWVREMSEGCTAGCPFPAPGKTLGNLAIFERG